jgi:hypothetical protein
MKTLLLLLIVTAIVIVSYLAPAQPVESEATE